MTEKNTPEQVSLSLTPTEIEIIDRVSEEMGISNRSATLRYIIRDWQRLQDEQHPVARRIRKTA